MKFRPVRRIRFLSFIFLAAIILATVALAASNGTNEWPGGRIGYRLDTHYGQVAASAPDISLYLDDACTKPNGAHRLEAGDWAVVYFPANQYGNYAVTYPITEPQDGGIDDGDEYTTHYIRGSDLQYIVSGTGNFSGTDWNQETWWNHLPTSIGYTSKLPGNGDTTYVGNNVDGGVGGGFQVISELSGNGYYQLWTGDSHSEIMSGSLLKYCWYDDSRTDITDADYSWNLLSQPWNTNGLHQGYNLISYAGMDASGNYATGQRYLWWDTLPPLMDTNLPAIQNSPGHSGWLNLTDYNSDQNVVVLSHDDVRQTTDVSGLNPASLRTDFDGVNCWGDGAGYQGFDTFDANSGTKNYSLRSIMQAMGVQADGTGGQGTHSFQFSSIDNAWNTAVIGATVQIDTVPPTATVNPVTGQFNSTADGIALALTFADATSGVDTSSTYYQWVQEGSSPTDSGWQQYTGQTVTQTQKGVWELYYKASDIAGNSMTGHSGPYYCGSLAGYIQNPGTAYTNGQDVIASVYVKSSDSGDITPTNNASVSLTAKDANGNVLTTQTKQLVVPNDEMQLVWYKFHVPADAIGPVSLTATINSSLADAQHNPFGLNVQSGAAAAADFYDDMDDSLPSWVDTTMAAPTSTNTRASWQQWSYANGTFTHNTYSASAAASLKITADPDSPSTVKTDPTTGHVTMKSGYPIIEKPTVTVQTNAILDAITGAQSVFARYPEWNYGYDHANLMTQTSSASDTASKTISGKFDLPENKYVTERLFSQFALDHITEPNFHITPGKFFERSNNYTALITAQDIWTPAGTIEASATDNVTFNGYLVNEWAPDATNKYVLGY